MTCREPQAPRYAVGKVGISAVTMNETLCLLDQQVQTARPAYVCVANVRTVVLSQKDEDFCKIENSSLLTVPDGMPLVWFAKLAGIKSVERVVGVDLMVEILRLSKEKNYSLYFLGDTEETLTKMTRIIKDRYPGVIIKDAVSPPFRELTDKEISNIAREINRLKPTFVCIALGAPKQERFMAKLIYQIDKSILIGVGAAFRFMIGHYKHPPRFIQLCGLEGVSWRFGRNPAKETWWYFCHVPWVVWFLLRAFFTRIRRSRNA